LENADCKLQVGRPLRVYGSLCSGIGCSALAWGPLGWRTAFFAEIEKFPSAVLAHYHGDTPNLGDITAGDFCSRATEAIGGRRLFALEAGTPCQAFSVAGLRQSLADDRGNLTLRFLEICNELDPEWIVWENVPGVLSTADNAFGCLLAGLVGESEPIACGLRDGRWPNAGVVVGPRRALGWRVLDAEYFHLAQRRRRVFVVARRAGNGDGVAAVLFEPESLPRHSPPGRQAGPGAARAVTPSTGGPSGDGEVTPIHNEAIAYGGGNTAGPIDVATACLAKGGTRRSDFESQTFIARQSHGTNVAGAGVDIRHLTPREHERLQGFPDDYTRIEYRGKPAADGPRYKALGNSMARPCMAWLGERIETVRQWLAGATQRPDPQCQTARKDRTQIAAENEIMVNAGKDDT